MIPYSTQCIEEDDIEVVTQAMRHEWLTGGPKVKAFEEKFARYVGAKYAVAMSNCTAVLHAACAVIGVGKGDEVITSANTMASSANAVLYCGGHPVFADIDPRTYNINPKDIRKKITKQTKAIIAVDYAGQPCDLNEILDIAKQYDLVVVEDAAHAAGASYKGRKVGSVSDLTVFSFHPVKTMTTLEGGMITTDNEEWYRKLLLFRTHGICRTKEMMDEHGPWFSEQILLGYNYRLTDVQSALGINQLKKLDRFVNRRCECAAYYDKELKDLPGIVLPYQAKGCFSSYHLYPILVNPEYRKELYQKLRESDIGVGVHYYPVYLHKFYQENGYDNVCCPISEEFYARELTLPAHPKITNDDLLYIVSTIKKIWKHM